MRGPAPADPPFNTAIRIGLLSGLRLRKHRNKCAAFQTFMKGHVSFGGCKDRVVTTKANTLARPPLGAALTHDDVARNDDFSTELLHAKATTG